MNIVQRFKSWLRVPAMIVERDYLKALVKTLSSSNSTLTDLVKKISLENTELKAKLNNFIIAQSNQLENLKKEKLESARRAQVRPAWMDEVDWERQGRRPPEP